VRSDFLVRNKKGARRNKCVETEKRRGGGFADAEERQGDRGKTEMAKTMKPRMSRDNKTPIIQNSAKPKSP